MSDRRQGNANTPQTVGVAKTLKDYLCPRLRGSYFWGFFILLPFCALFTFNITATSNGPFSDDTGHDLCIYQIILIVGYSFVTVVLFISRTDITKWTRLSPNEKHLPKHITVMVAVSAVFVIVCYGYQILYFVLASSSRCGDAMLDHDSLNSPWYYGQFFATLFYNGISIAAIAAIFSWLTNLNERYKPKQNDTLGEQCCNEINQPSSDNDLGDLFWFARSMGLLVIAVQYVKMICAEAIEILDKLYEGISEESQNSTVGQHEVNYTALCPDTPEWFITFYTEWHPFFASATFLLAAESLLLLLVIVVELSTKAQDDTGLQHSTPPTQEAAPVRNFANWAWLLLFDSSLVGTALAKIYISFDAHLNNKSGNVAAYVRWGLRIWQTVLMYAATRLRKFKGNDEDFFKDNANPHTKLDIQLLFFCLPVLYMLYFASIISAALPWNTVDGDLYQHERINAIIDAVLAILCYTVQFVGFKQFMNLAPTGLHQHYYLVQHLSAAYFWTNLLVLIDVWLDLRYADQFIVTSLYYYPTALWAIFVIIAYPALCFFNAHSMVCMVDLWKHARNARRDTRTGPVQFSSGVVILPPSTVNAPPAVGEINTNVRANTLP